MIRYTMLLFLSLTTCLYAEAPTAVSVGDYRVEVRDSGLCISYGQTVISQASSLEFYRDNRWQELVMHDLNFNRLRTQLKEITVSGPADARVLRLTGTINQLTIVYQAMVKADGVTLSVKASCPADTPKPAIRRWGVFYFPDALLDGATVQGEKGEPVELKAGTAARMPSPGRQFVIRTLSGNLQVTGSAPGQIEDHHGKWYKAPWQTVGLTAREFPLDKEITWQIRVIPPELTAEPRILLKPEGVAIPELTLAKNEDIGNQAVWLRGETLALRRLKSGEMPQSPTTVRVFHANDRLHVRFHCEEPKMAAMQQQLPAPKAWTNDCVEVFIAPEDASDDYYLLIINWRGELYTSWKQQPYKLTGVNTEVKLEKDAWNASFSIPWQSLGIDPRKGQTVKMNFTRENHLVPELSTWAPVMSFQETANFRPVGLQTSPVSFGLNWAGNNEGFPVHMGICQLPLLLHNHTNQTMTVIPRVQGKEKAISGSPQTLAPGTTQQIAMTIDIKPEDSALQLSVVAPEGQTLVKTPPYYFATDSLAECFRQITENLAYMTKHDASPQLRTPAEGWQTRAAGLQQLTVGKKLPDIAWTQYRREALAMRDVTRAGLPFINGQKLANYGYFLYAEQAMTKVKQQFPLPSKPAGEIYLEGFRNDYLNGQLVIVPFGCDLTQTTVNLEDLVDASGTHRIPASELHTGFVQYINSLQGESWPDIISDVPAMDISRRALVQPVWVTVHIPANVPAGEYHSRITVRTANAGIGILPLRIKVWDYTLPEKNTLPVLAGYSEGPVRRYLKNKPVTAELQKQWRDFIQEHRLLPFPGLATFITEYERETAPRIDAEVNFDLQRNPFFIAGSMPWPRAVEAYLKTRKDGMTFSGYVAAKQQEFRQYADHLRKRDWLKQAEFYYDEIFDYEGRLPWLADFLSQLRRDGYRTMAVLLVKPEDLDFYRPHVDDPVFPMRELHRAEFQRQIVRPWQQEGKRIFGYLNLSNNMPSFNMLSAAGTAPTVQFWYLDHYRLDGAIAWGLNFWSAIKDNNGIPSTSGDGLLAYPGRNGNPCSSIRLALLRDGIEDYMALAQLRANVLRLRAASRPEWQPAIAAAEKFLKGDWLPAFTQYPRQAETLLAARRELAENLVRTEKLLHP